MIQTKILLCLWLLHVCECADAFKKCDSCMPLRECPDLVNLITNNSNPAIQQKLGAAVCGVTHNMDGKRIATVCCSDFMDVSDRIADTETDIESHKNIALIPEKCGVTDVDRIIGGVLANLYEFPWMVLISYHTESHNGIKMYTFKCGGTIVNSRYVLTAAHCVVGKIIAGVRVGEYNMRTREDCQGEHPHYICENHIQDVKVTKFIPHKDYKPMPNIQNDIALLRLKKPIDFSFKNVAPVCLPLSNILRNRSLGGRRAIVAGWGITEAKKASSVLRKVNIAIHTDNECREYYNRNSVQSSNILLDKKFCAGETGKDSCEGDSGGPLMLEEEYKGKFRMIQFGIVSFGPLQCGYSTPGVYTDVRQYVKWILDNIEP